MEKTILKFAEQFNFEPEIENALKLGELAPENNKHFIICGMGGSHLSADILKMLSPETEIFIHSDYGLPKYSEEFLKESLLIAISHSGNTEESIDFIDEAYSKGFNVAVITSGGEMQKFANENGLPLILLPNDSIQPRVAIAYVLIALAKLIKPSIVSELKKLSQNFDPQKNHTEGKNLAQNLINKNIIIYTSKTNRAIGYIWKITLNETAKIPAFNNVFPELNHNEMQGYDFIQNTKALSENLHFIFLRDANDDPRIEKRMSVTENLLQGKGLPVTSIYLEGDTLLDKIFSTIILGNWIALEMAKIYNSESEQVPFIEEFKKRIK